jgi:AraC-like DNA-binding protein
MRTKNSCLVGKAEWVDLLASPKSRVRVRLSGTPARFATPPEWDTRLLRLDEHLVYFFAKKSARAEVAGESFACPRGSCCWVTPGTTFRFRSSQSPLVWRFRFSLTAPGRRGPIAPRGAGYFFASAPALAETMHALLDELAHADRWQHAALRCWLAELSILFFRSSGPERKPRVLTRTQREAIAALLENARPDQFLQPRDLAQATGLTLDYFSRIFHRSHGISPRQWLVRQRLAHALVLLQETPLRIGEIAQRLGYANVHLFSRQFSAYYGASPRSHR